MGLQKSLLSDYIGITKQIIGFQKKKLSDYSLHSGLQKKPSDYTRDYKKRPSGL